MPICQKYQASYVYGELDRIIGDNSLIGHIQGTPSIILVPFRYGFHNGLGVEKTDRIEIQTNVSDSDLADKLRSMAQGIFDFGQEIGKDLLEDIANKEMIYVEAIPFFETVLSYFISYVNSPAAVEGFRKENRRTPRLASLLPPEKNTN